ncbi:MAG: hypothetical protein JNM17_30565 [Archangium sp.]|nr:hypothetical protein [Archangium sp.]
MEDLLRATNDRLTRLEEAEQQRVEAFALAQKTLERIRKRRNRGGVPMWEAAQRAALRTVILAVGCVLLISGAATIDSTLGGVAIVASFVILMAEAIR